MKQRKRKILYALLHIREKTNKDLLYGTDNYTQYFVITLKYIITYKGKQSKKE